MITKERVEELKNKYQKEVVYYETLGFDILQGKFQEVVNFLTEIENLLSEYEKLKEEADYKIKKAIAANDGESVD